MSGTSSTKYETDLNLTLGLPGIESSESRAPTPAKHNKRTLADIGDEVKSDAKTADTAVKSYGCSAPAAKAQVVGWPPIRSYRKNSLQVKKAEAEAAGIYVKVRMDGAPYLRKIDLKVYKGYPELLKALGDMFKCFSLADFSIKDGYSGSEFVPTYEDKDGDWMLVGDVPWEMFTSSCNRLRIMKGSEARGLGSSL